MCTLIANMAQCERCDSVVESTHRWDYVACACGDIAVDGGRDYYRRVTADGARYRDLNIFRPCDDWACPDKSAENIFAEAMS